MTVYLDTSALVKRYVREPGTARVLTLWRQANHLATSRLTYAETVCAVRRKARTEPPAQATLEVFVYRGDSTSADVRVLPQQPRGGILTAALFY